MRSRLYAWAFAGTAAAFAAVLAWPEPAYTHKPITTNILFKNEIAQIFQRKCFQCHSENNVSFPLTTYTEARPWARAIREEILDREMPPWQAVPGYGHFANDLSLTTREKEIILSWTDGGAPSGVLKAEESIPPVYVAAEPTWDHGAPDRVFPVGSHSVASYAPFEVKRFVVATDLKSATRVKAIALKQGDRRVVRYAAFYDESTGRWLGAWTPWQTTAILPGETAIPLAANAKIVVEIGYAGGEQDVTDASELGVYFEKDPRGHSDAFDLASAEQSLAPGTTAHRVRVESTLAADTELLALWPNPGPGARSIEITAVTPDGMMQPLLWIDQYRPEWRSSYVLSAPVALPRGTRLALTTYFGNDGEQALTTRAQAWIVTAASPQGSARRR